MPTNLSGRFLLILTVLLGCLYILFPEFYRGNLKPNIRPGIDMVGGSSLLYQIKAEPGKPPAPDLAERMISSLRTRIDPDGVKNLVWRASGADKIEIQLPSTPESQEARPRREAFAKATQQIEELNLHRVQIEALLDLPAEKRAAAFNDLAQGSTKRAELFAKLNDTKARLDSVLGKDADAEAKASIELDAQLDSVTSLNVEASEVEQAVTPAAASAATAAGGLKPLTIEQLKARDPIYAKPIDDYAVAYQSFQQVKDAVGDVGELKRMLRGSGVLSFHICVKAADAGIEVVSKMIDRLEKDGPRMRPGDEMAWIVNDRPGERPGGSTIGRVYKGQLYLLVWMNLPNSLRNREGTQKWSLTSAFPTRGQNGESLVAFNFDPVGANLFGDLTGRHRPDSPNGPFDLAAVLDNKVISNATIQSQIRDHGTISGGGKTGGFSNLELDYLVKTLSAGSLPAQLEEEPQVERTVGPQLGADNLRAGFIACGFGVGVVAIFLTGYYYIAGAVALVAMAINLVLILAGLSALGSTFTLPGVAGIILTIGMAVDANVLIFERLREEQHRGLSLRVAMRNAYDRAFTAIMDSNVTAAITGLILYVIGTEDVKGFGLTLLLGILSSLFTSLFVTKTIFAFLIDRMGVDKISSIPVTFPKWDRLLHPRIDWIGKAWVFVTISTIFIGVGFTMLVVKLREGSVLDIEFAGGTIVQFNLKEPMAQSDVRKLIESEAAKTHNQIDAPAVQSVGDAVKTADGRTGYKSYEVVTVTSDTDAVRHALSEALVGKLDVAQPATFVGAKTTLEQARDAVVVPIESEAQKIAGFTPKGIADHVGGAAVVLKDLVPRLTADDVRQRLTLRGTTSASGSTKKYSVQALPDSSGLIVLGSDSAVGFDPNNPATLAEWTSDVARPLWATVNDAVGNPEEFGRVSKINESVAGETGTNAIIALITSITLIVIYVWIRFGDLKYGSATVIALAHDVLFLIASIGWAHLLSGTIIGDALLMHPFRINLTMVSAILAIIGFSMSDTVVIFDRIRENRIRAGRLDRQLVNDSINQTVGRTLLMGVTTLATLLVMYVTGGEAIHGFTFALFFGLLTGVYSSVAIASPILLWGGPKVDALQGDVIDPKGAVPA